MAILLQHRSAPVNFDPPMNSVEAAIRHSERERQQVLRAMRQTSRDEDILELSRIVDCHGADTVALWLRNITLSVSTAGDPRR